MSILLALTMLLGTVSVLGSAYTPYKNIAAGDNNITYDDVDNPVFSVNQYASMAIDEVDRMLAKEQIKLDVYVLTLDLTSVDAALACVATALETIGTLTGLLGDVQYLNASALRVGNVADGDPRARLKTVGGVTTGNTEDIDILYSLLKFLSDNTTTIFSKYVNGTISLGVLQSVVSDYIFNVRELASGFLYSLIAPEDTEGNKYDYFEDGGSAIPTKYNADGTGTSTVGFDLLVQDLLNYFVLGDWVKLDDYFTANDGKGVAVLDENGVQVIDDEGNLVYDKRDFDDYDFGTGNETMDVATKDYYGWFHRDNWVTYALGGTAVVNNGATAPDPIYTTIDLNSASVGYDFIETLMRVAYNKIAVPELNTVTKPWLREACGITYIAAKSDPTSTQYVENYNGEPYVLSELEPFAAIFDLENMYVPLATVPSGGTFVGSINDILGEFLECILMAEEGTSWTWTYSTTDGNGIANDGNQYLFTNIVSVAKYVLKEVEGAFFSDYITPATDAEIDNMNDQQVVAYVLRAIVNGSIDWLFIPNDANNDTIAEVAYSICEQMAYQDIPQYSYTRPVKGTLSDADFNKNLVDACLNILLDVAVYNLNQSIDMVPTVGTNPLTSNGLLQYANDYKGLVLQIVCWAFKNYAPALAFDLSCQNATGSTTGLTIDNVWTDLDTLINNIVPIKGATAWINTSISSQTYVVKSLLFDNIVAAVTELNPTPLDAIFQKNTAGALGTQNVKSLAITLVTNIINNLLFPGLLGSYANFDAVLRNNVLATIVTNLINSLYTRREDLLFVLLPIVCSALGLSSNQEFEEIEVYLPEHVNANTVPAGGLKFAVYNGSSGLNTSYMNSTGTRIKDQLYVYDIDTVAVKVNNAATGAAVTNHGIVVSGISSATTIAGGQNVEVSLGGSLSANQGNIVELQIKYNVLGEDGTALTSQALNSSAFTYISNADGGDDVVKYGTTSGDNEIKYYTDVYLGRGDRLTGLEGYSVEIKTPSASSFSLSSVTVSGSTPFITAATVTPVNPTSAGGRYFPTPMKVAAYDTDFYKRVEPVYTQNDPENPIEDFESEFTGTYTSEPGQIPNGLYTVTSNFIIGGTAKAVATRVHLFDDFNLDGIYNNAVSKNRQQSDYDMEADSGAAAALFTTYQTALRNVANLVLSDKNGSNFETFITTNVGTYTNLYHKYAEELDAAIEALEPYELSAGVSSLKSAVASYSPYNYSVTLTGSDYSKVIVDAETGRTDLEYYETGYSFFGMRDFVPHTYSRYKSERNTAQGIIDQQMILKPLAPINPGEDATASELEEYNNALTQYNKDLENYARRVEDKAILSAVDAAYAEHMVELTGDRLIYLTANVSKLQAAFNLYNYTNGTYGGNPSHPAGLVGTSGNQLGTSNYLESRWEDYVTAVDFAQATLAISTSATDINGHPLLRPSRVNAAISNLVESWKKLVDGIDKTALNAAIANANSYITGTFLQDYTEASANALLTARDNAVDLVNAELADTVNNAGNIQRAISAITAAIAGLEAAQALDPVITIVTSDPGVFWDPSWIASYTPVVNSTYTDKYSWNFATPTYFITGLGMDITEDMITQNIFETVQNATLEVIPTANGYGTGTLVNVYNTNSELIQSYYLVVNGDVTGDCSCGLDDLGITNLAAIGIYDWVWSDPSLNVLACGGDLNNDGEADLSDYGFMKFVAVGSGYVNQDLGNLAWY